MARYVSFALLLAVIVLLSIMFYKVMASFLIPLFLAALLVVIFSPLYEWMSTQLQRVAILAINRRARQLAALLTTGAVSLLVLVPFATLVVLAANEARDVLTHTSTSSVVQKIKQARTSLNLDLPAAEEIRSIQQLFLLLHENMKPEELEYQRQLLFEIKDTASELGRQYDLKFDAGSSQPTDDDADRQVTESEVPIPWSSFCRQLTQLRDLNDQLAAQSPFEPEGFHDYQVEIIELDQQFRKLKSQVLLGTNGWLKELVNPSETKLLEYGNSAFEFARDQLFKFGSASTSFLGRLVIGTAIMLFALFFFLLDGRSMIESLKGLSPLDDNHEQELVDEFNKVSRAVVLATLLSAIAQGLLAGIGFYFVGLDSIFLLTILTTCLALVPFVGAAAVWVPCSLYLYFVEHSLVGGIGLAIYGSLVISMADNFIKPWVLHGQSHLHPLLAFLSIIGGVGALGPIGLLIGPMVVAFLQTLLKIFQREVRSLDDVNLQRKRRMQSQLRRFHREVRPFAMRKPRRTQKPANTGNDKSPVK